MNKALFLLFLREMYGINRLIHTKDKKIKRNGILLTFAWGLVLLVCFFYICALVFGLSFLGLGEIVPLYLTVLASAMLFIFGFFKAGPTLFAKKGYELLASLPVKTAAIVQSRLAVLYLEDVLFTLLLFIPGSITYAILEKPAFYFYPITFIGIFFISLFPLVLSALLGTGVMALSSRAKKNSYVQTILTLALALAILFASLFLSPYASTLTKDNWTYLASTIGSVLGKFYLPGLWLSQAMLQGNIGSLLLYIAFSCVCFLASLLLVTRFFRSIMHALLRTFAKHQYKIGQLAKNSLLLALYKREAKRYFSSSIYVVNTIIGPIIGFILSLALYIVGTEKIVSALPPALSLPVLYPFVFSGIFCLMTTTSVSISMEGKSFWTVQSLPISAKSLFDSKILLNLSLMLPFYLASEILLLLSLRPSFEDTVYLILFPLVIMLFSTVFGLTVNLLLHRFDWEKEETIVKQSASAALGGFSGSLLSFFLGVIVLILPAQIAALAKPVLLFLVAALTFLLYRKNNQTRLEKL